MLRCVDVALPLVLLLFPALACAADAEQDRRIANIEKGLRPAQALTGAPVPLVTLAGEMRRLHVPGVSVAVIHQGRLAWAKGYGVVTPGGAAVTPDTLFQAASISKPVTAVGAMILEQANKIDLRSDANKQLRSWKVPPGPNGATVTPMQLLSHTAGMTVSGFPGYAAGTPVPTVLQVLDGVSPANTAPVRVQAAPGSAWQYSGGAYTVLQQLIEDTSRQPFATYMQAQVLAPLGMKDSRFTQPADAAILARAALPHDSGGKPYAGGPSTYPELAAAGMWTTPSDLARFAIGVQNAAAGRSRVLEQSTARTMLTPVKNGYALGFEMSGQGAATAFAHGGSNRGYQNYLYAFVGGGDGAVVMTNGDAGDELARATLRAIASEYGWPSYKTIMRSAAPVDAAMLKQMTGKYAIPGLGDFDITADNGKPIFWLKAGQGEPLYRQDATRFFVLSQQLELTFDALPGDTGTIVSGPFDVKFQRVGPTKK